MELEKDLLILASTLLEWFLGLLLFTFSCSSSKLIFSISRYLLFLFNVLDAMKDAYILLKPVDLVFRADMTLFNIIFITYHSVILILWGKSNIITSAGRSGIISSHGFASLFIRPDDAIFGSYAGAIHDPSYFYLTSLSIKAKVGSSVQSVLSHDASAIEIDSLTMDSSVLI